MLRASERVEGLVEYAIDQADFDAMALEWLNGGDDDADDEIASSGSEWFREHLDEMAACSQATGEERRLRAEALGLDAAMHFEAMCQRNHERIVNHARDAERERLMETDR